MTKTLREHIDTFDGSDEAFAAMIKAAVEFDGTEAADIQANIVEIADSMRLSQTTVTRWFEGTSAPVPSLRPIIAKALANLYYPRSTP